MNDQKTPLYVLTAPVGQLCGNGQLRETISERRKRKGDDVAFWYLSPELVRSFNISENDLEAVVAEEQTSIIWLQLRFGGEISIKDFYISELRKDAYALPPGPNIKDISTSD